MSGMAAVADPRGLRIEVEWVSGDGVATPELAATWSRLAIWIGERCATLVGDPKSGVRQSIYTSAYPLAEWIAYNWWQLRHEIRVSATSSQSWTWSSVGSNPWLRRHNFRAAGGGMPWPDITVVPEGAASRVIWRSGAGLARQSIRFLEGGDVYLSSQAVATELARFVTEVVDRLDDVGVSTPLTKEWRALSELDEEEADFARAAARLGLDPFAMAEDAQDQLIAIASSIPQPLLDEFLDSADPYSLPAASAWLSAARVRARTVPVSSRAVVGLGGQRDTSAIEPVPFQRGYALARAVRAELGIQPRERLDIKELVSKATVGRPSAGLEGFTGVRPSGEVVLVLPGERLHPTAVRFAQARALGLALVSDRTESLLDPASTDLMKETRAFAAELLAPADGIREYLGVLPATTDQAFDAVAARFDASSWLVQHQYENQILQP
jgi:hypothetical protein